MLQIKDGRNQKGLQLELNKMGELVSIIMPSYNTAAYVEETIQSVFNQTYTNWELLFVDDCSSDETLDLIKKYTLDSRFRVFKGKKNSGAAVCRNKALREAKGKWVAFLDSDDLWYPEKLENQISFMKKNGYHFTYTDYEEIDEDGNRMHVLVTGPKRITRTGMFRYCWPGCLTVMYDREFVGEVQIKNIRKNNDYAMWLKVCKKADCFLLDECLAKYRRGRKGSISTHNKVELIKWHYELFHECEHFNTIKSFIFTGRNIAFGILKKKLYVSRSPL